MIGISFQLTPAQTKMLLSVAYEHFEGDLCLPAYRSGRNDFVTIMGGLIRRGLVQHNSDTTPSYTATEAGLGLASMIVSSCRDMLNMADGVDGRRKVWKPIADIENRRKAAYRRKIDTAAKGAKEGA